MVSDEKENSKASVKNNKLFWLVPTCIILGVLLISSVSWIGLSGNVDNQHIDFTNAVIILLTAFSVMIALLTLVLAIAAVVGLTEFRQIIGERSQTATETFLSQSTQIPEAVSSHFDSKTAKSAIRREIRILLREEFPIVQNDMAEREVPSSDMGEEILGDDNG